MRLIDVDELKKKSRCIEISECGRRSALLKNWVVSELDINAAPTVEAVPVKHGHWVYGEFGTPHCSKCGKEIKPNDISPFCPNCGAKMGGDEND